MKTTGILLLIIALFYISWFFVTEDVGAILLFINLVMTASIFLFLTNSPKPRKKWFAAKRFGWGWYPETKEGWMLTVVMAALIILSLLAASRNALSVKSMILTALPFVLQIAAVMFAISYKYGEKPHWRWGKK